ncbi:hypothetical protein ARMGADRAFT_80065 [Armillaria gallica]|uniref:Uncharacterized protein n=1 Tax=Armillaria gallica TaxID=47427 RepID=A0A2H3CG82_ARMGA|nr:hypothetical protein ARMGADRAFT_80065 [Armillaria gallica]
MLLSRTAVSGETSVATIFTSTRELTLLSVSLSDGIRVQVQLVCVLSLVLLLNPLPSVFDPLRRFQERERRHELGR